jgi:hypothetical protein
MIFSILLAYPVTGALLGIYELLVLASTSPKLVLGNPCTNLLFVVYSMILVTSCGGYAPSYADCESGTNMYPWIIPTAFALFFLFSRGWLLFKRRNS